MPSTATDDRDHGVTLIEMLVVIVVLGVLAAIAAPVYLGHRDRAVVASETADARSLATQLETFFVDAQRYPVAGELTWLPAPGVVQFGSTGEVVRLSPHNQAQVLRAGERFCVEVRNTVTPAIAVFESGAGGLRSTGADAACPEDYDTIVLAYPADG